MGLGLGMKIDEQATRSWRTAARLDWPSAMRMKKAIWFN